MKICAIIAEYNPLHTGHSFHIKEIKKFADLIVVILTSDITQRGEFAMFSKFCRAKAALLQGANLVLELPAIFSCSSAENFAHGAMRIVKELKFISHLSFGSEDGDIKKIIKTAKICKNIEKTNSMKYFLKKGFSYPKARQLAVGKMGKILKFPNNTLGVEYVKAAMNLQIPISFHTTKRIGAHHNSEKITTTASSSFLRKNIENFEQLKKFIPKNIIDIFHDPIKIPNEFIFNSLRQTTKNEFSNLPDATEGLHNRLFKASRNAKSLEDFFNIAKTKRYTLSRLKRIAMYSFLKLNKKEMPKLPQYSFVLGFDKLGQKLLSLCKNREFLITTNFKKIHNQFTYSASIDSTVTDFVSLFLQNPQPCNINFKQKPIII